MYEKILIPLDGSRAAEIVLPYAIEIAAEVGSEILLVSVSESRAVDSIHLYGEYLERIAEQTKRQLSDRVAKKEGRSRCNILLGQPAKEILRYADEKNVDLIIMASRGSSHSGPWLLGNVVNKVIRASHTPLLLIRAPASETALQEKRLVKRILLPLDGSEVGEAAIPCTAELARILSAELVLCQVIHPITAMPDYSEVGAISPSPSSSGEVIKASAIAYLDGVANLLLEKGLRTSSVVVLGSPADQIIDYAKANAIDLIAMSTHGRSGIGRWVFGSITDKVLHAGDTPVLVVPTLRV